MYIDKIYTKLYSNKDWNGLNQLVNEIKSFARKDYEGLGFMDRVKQRALRNGMADYLYDVKNRWKNTKVSEDAVDIADSTSKISKNILKREAPDEYALANLYHPFTNDSRWGIFPRPSKYLDKLYESTSAKNRLKALGQELGVTTRDTLKDLKKTTSDKLDKFKNKWSDFISRFKNK